MRCPNPRHRTSQNPSTEPSRCALLTKRSSVQRRSNSEPEHSKCDNAFHVLTNSWSLQANNLDCPASWQAVLAEPPKTRIVLVQQMKQFDLPNGIARAAALANCCTPKRSEKTQHRTEQHQRLLPLCIIGITVPRTGGKRRGVTHVLAACPHTKVSTRARLS